MAYATGTGANQQDFLDALRSFAAAQGWTISKWDTTNKLLYLEKGVCHVALEWVNSNITVYTGNTGNTVSEGRIRGTLCKTLGAGTDFSAFTGNVSVSGMRNYAPLVYMTNVQGPYVGWFLFSDAGGNYIHAIIQTSADMYAFLFFGNADKGTLTHSGAAYLVSDGGRIWFRNATLTSAPPSSSGLDYNDSGKMAAFFGDMGARFTAAYFHVYSEDALPSGFTNQQAIPSFRANSAYCRTQSRGLNMRNTQTGQQTKPDVYLKNSGSAGNLLDNVIVMSAPGHSQFVPMMGVPLGVTNETTTLCCMVGMIPDLRFINLTGMTPQQEIALGTDTWKVFPCLRQTNWSDSKTVDAASSGQFGFALKKVA